MTTVTLSRLQSHFQAYLMQASLSTILPSITEDTGLDATKRLKIYFDAYRLRLLEILTIDYPKLHTLMGGEAFDELGRAYIDAHPSAFFSVRYFGKSLRAYLTAQTPYQNHPYLAEMAAFEWALNETLDAKDQPILSQDGLHAISPENFGYLCLTFHPSLQLMECAWDIPQLWGAIEGNETPRSPIKLPAPVVWIVWRNHLTSQFRSLSSHQATIVRLFQQQKNFAEVCEALCDDMEESEVPMLALSFIQQCFMDGLVVGVNYP